MLNVFFKGGNIMELNLDTILAVVNAIMGLLKKLMAEGFLDDLF